MHTSTRSLKSTYRDHIRHTLHIINTTREVDDFNAEGEPIKRTVPCVVRHLTKNRNPPSFKAWVRSLGVDHRAIGWWSRKKAQRR